MLRRRPPPPRFADSPLVHAAIGAPIGAALAVVLQTPPRGSLDHLVVGAIAGAVLAVALGALRPEPSERPELPDEPEEGPQEPVDWDR